MNSTTRTFAMMPPAFLVTSALIMVMVSLIGAQHKKAERVAKITLPEILLPPEEVVEAKVIEKPTKPPIEQTPPPQVHKQPHDKLTVGTKMTVVDPGKFKVEPVITKGNTLADTSALPIFKVAPIYPGNAKSRGVEGDVLVEFTVTTSGSIRDAVIISSDSPLLDKEALKAVLKWRYRPQVINGLAVEKTGMRTVIKFRLENA